MTAPGDEGTKGLIPFSYIITLIVPVTAPLFALGLYREGESGHAAAVTILGFAWAVTLYFLILR